MELPSFCSTLLRNYLRPARGATVAWGILFISLPNLAFASIYPLNQLKQDITKFLAKEYSATPHQRIDISVSNLDNRLRLASCIPAPAFTLQDSTGNGGNISVKAECKSGKPWSVHVPAQVNIYRKIPVAQGNIARGEVISQAHIGFQLANVSSIRQTFLSDPQEIIGKEAKRNISQGEPFKTALLDAPTAVKRGELVTLESQAGSIKVSSVGTAMADGRVGQQIRVRNNSSERIISGVVISQGVVQTL
jgi:flagella basal body P-ring formation protein FlgA